MLEDLSLREYRRRICRAMDFISGHLEENLSLDDIAGAACFSKFHFHRLFHALVGEPVGRFTKRLRLEKSANMLMYDPSKDITAVALECGFSSSQNFARVFRRHFDFTPSEFRERYSKIGDQKSKDRHAAVWTPVYDVGHINWPETSEQGRNTMNVEMKEMPDFHVAYVRNIGPYGPEGCGRAFEKLMQWAGHRGLVATETFLGVSWDNPEVTPPDKCRYDACVTVPPGTQTEDQVGLQTIPGGLFAVYHCRIRVDEFPRVWMELMDQWLPRSGYQPDDKPPYELYLKTGMEDPEGLWSVDICCPVKPL